MKFALYCQCGGRAEIDAPERWEVKLRKAFWSAHKGQGHGEIDRAQWHINKEKPTYTQLTVKEEKVGL